MSRPAAKTPVKRAAPRRTKTITPAIAAKFCELVASGHTHASAAKSLGFNRASFTHPDSGLVARDASFAAALDDALESGTQQLEREALRRAAEGVDEPVYQGGKLVGTVTKYSDTLLIFMLKARRPEVYRDNQRVELTGAGGGPMEVLVEHDYDRLLTKLEHVGLIRRGPAALADAAALPVLPARTD